VTGYLRRHDVGCTYAAVSLTLLGIAEYAVVTILIAPYASTRADWLTGTLLVAPAAALFVLMMLIAAGRILYDTVRIIRWTAEKIRPHRPKP
jgi:hypothetical protein